ncbi:MAG: hypothetical protein IV093_13950 [Rubrivivax sp.]|nr:hypothetical protein [Rubrivivax sp.]
MTKTFLQRSVQTGCAALLAVCAAAVSAQTTTLSVDALANCVGIFGGTNNPVPSVTLQPGTYSVKVKSSTATYCADGTCPHPATAVTIFDGNSYVSETFIIKATGLGTKLTLPATAFVWAYFLDTECSDNAGGSSLQFTLRN